MDLAIIFKGFQTQTHYSLKGPGHSLYLTFKIQCEMLYVMSKWQHINFYHTFDILWHHKRNFTWTFQPEIPTMKWPLMGTGKCSRGKGTGSQVPGAWEGMQAFWNYNMICTQWHNQQGAGGKCSLSQKPCPSLSPLNEVR